MERQVKNQTINQEIQTMREEHLQQVERWAHFVKENPTKWKKIHTEFIDAIFEKHDSFKEKLLQTPNGKEKLQLLYKIKNQEGYDWLRK
ncbi:MAG: hypothetical protein AABX31_00140 [Nanoarchaeota archaeon]